MNKLIQFFKESYTEMIEHVTWPTWTELQNSAGLVLVSSLIIAIIVFAMDQGANLALNTFYTSLAK